MDPQTSDNLPRPPDSLPHHCSKSESTPESSNLHAVPVMPILGMSTGHRQLILMNTIRFFLSLYLYRDSISSIVTQVLRLWFRSWKSIRF